MATTQIDDRYITVGKVGTIATGSYQPNDIFIYTFDYADWLGGLTTIASATVTASAKFYVPPTVSIVLLNTTTVQVKVVGGTNGDRVTVTVAATMADTQVKEAELVLSVIMID